jgi:hypothetical protein
VSYYADLDTLNVYYVGPNGGGGIFETILFITVKVNVKAV